MFNLHTHTFRCNHAVGEDREHVEGAIRAGYTEIGFSDHAPMLFPEESGYYSNFRMRPEAFEDYVKSVLDLKAEYKNDIAIHLGLEVEYYPALFEQSLAFYSQYPLEYMLLGQHFIGNEHDNGSVYSAIPSDDPKIIRLYVHQILEGLSTGKFTCLAHPDLIHFSGDKNIWRFEMEKLCRGAKEMGIPLEINMLGFADGRHYPNRKFWEIARSIGNEIVVGLDTHNPAVWEDAEMQIKLQKWIKKMKLNVREEMPTLRNPLA